MFRQSALRPLILSPFAAALALLTALPAPLAAAAEEFQAVRDRDAFLSLVDGRELRMPLFRIRLAVRPDGSIEGSALGWGVSGSWDWKDGYFCREMDWSGKEIPYNCQLVEAKGDGELRFTVDRGQGDSASFRLD